jgi:integrase
MVRVNLKGVAKATAKGRTYWYAWRGGPRLRGEPGSPEFISSYREAHESLRKPDASRFRSLVVQYKTDKLETLAASTRQKWAPWLDRIAEHFGDLSIAQFDRPEKIRPIIVQWRNRWTNKPRTADYGLQVLSAVLSYAVDPLGKVAGNPCEGIKQLYSSNRSEIIWTDPDIELLKKTCSTEIAQVVDLASHTGLRFGDLLRLSWSHIGDDALIIPTGKSKGRREAIVPLYDALREVLQSIPRRATTILTNRRHRPWTENGFSSAFNRAKHAAGLSDRNLHFHDLRGTAATRFYRAGLSKDEVADVMGWERDHVARIITRYVSRSENTRKIIRKLNKAAGKADEEQ